MNDDEVQKLTDDEIRESTEGAPTWDMSDDRVLCLIEQETLVKVTPLVLAWYMEVMEIGLTEQLEYLGRRLTALVSGALDQFEYDNQDQENNVYLFFGNPSQLRELQIQLLEDKESGFTDDQVLLLVVDGAINNYEEVVEFLKSRGVYVP